MAVPLTPPGAAAVESMAEGVIVRDASGTVLTVNPAAEAILGVSDAQLRGLEPVDPRWRLIREDGTALLSADLPSAQVIASGRAVRGQLIGVHKPDGSITWVRASAEPIRGTDGALTGVVGTCSDVTATERRRRVDQARLRLLARSPDATLEEVLRATIDEAERLTGSRIGFFHFVDADERTLLLQTWSTNTLERMCSAEGVGQHYPVAQAGVWADALRERRPVVHDDYASTPGRKGMPPGHAQVVREAVVPVFRGGRVCAMLGVGNKDASYVQGDVDELSLLADAAWEIAARKRTEEALRASEAALRQERERLARAVEAGKVGLWELDLATGRAWRTLEHDQIFGYDALQPTWGRAEALAHVVPEDRHLFEEAFDRARRTGIFHYELRIAPAGEPPRWIVADGKVVKDPTGAPARMVGTVVDVTSRRELEARVATNSRLAALGTAVAGVAHEINNPLVALTAGEGLVLEEAEDLLRELRSDAPPGPEAVASRVADIVLELRDAQSAAGRIARIVRDMALLARVDARRERVELRGVVDLALRWLPGSFPRDVQIRVEEAPAPDVEASQGQLEQVVVNLVTNAARAIPAGRAGTVIIRVGPGRPGAARLEVEDDGVGIPPGVLSRIFDPFFTTRRAGEGTGLGLPVTHSIVVAHGGTIEATSREGVGTRFRVELPAAKNSGG